MIDFTPCGQQLVCKVDSTFPPSNFWDRETWYPVVGWARISDQYAVWHPCVYLPKDGLTLVVARIMSFDNVRIYE